MMSYTTGRCLIWSFFPLWATLKANELWPCWIWPAIALTGMSGMMTWRIIADIREDDKERERVRKLEEFYEKHKDEE
jgi:hypothetical protein